MIDYMAEAHTLVNNALLRSLDSYQREERLAAGWSLTSVVAREAQEVALQIESEAEMVAGAYLTEHEALFKLADLGMDRPLQMMTWALRIAAATLGDTAIAMLRAEAGATPPPVATQVARF